MNQVFYTNIYLHKSFLGLLCLAAIAASHHVVFEDVGKIATSITYVHAAIPLNLTNIRNLAKHFGNALTLSSEPCMFFRKNHQHPNEKRLYWDDNYIPILEQEQVGLKRMFKFLKIQKQQIFDKLEHLTKIMPLFGTAPPSTVSATVHLCFHHFLSIPLFIVKGIFGTFMGLYNKRQRPIYKRR